MSDMAKRTIRFPPEVEATIAQRAADLDRSFSWVVIDACRNTNNTPRAQADATQAHTVNQLANTIQRGSPSPSLKRFG